AAPDVRPRALCVRQTRENSPSGAMNSRHRPHLPVARLQAVARSPSATRPPAPLATLEATHLAQSCYPPRSLRPPTSSARRLITPSPPDIRSARGLGSGQASAQGPCQTGLSHVSKELVLGRIEDSEELTGRQDRHSLYVSPAPTLLSQLRFSFH